MPAGLLRPDRIGGVEATRDQCWRTGSQDDRGEEYHDDRLLEQRELVYMGET